MLPTFRILLATTGLAVLAAAMTARGLIATPEVHTRIGEVPTISRSLIQQAMVPRLPAQALTNPVEERAVLLEATGMASGQEIVRLPLDRIDSNGTGQMTPGPTQAAKEAELTDPLGELIKMVISQTPEPPATIAAKQMPAQPREPGAQENPAPPPQATAAPAEAAGQLLATAPEVTSLPSKTQSEDTARADNGDETPVKSLNMAESEPAATTPPERGDKFGLPPPSAAPTLALGGEPTDRENANAESQGKAPAATTAALHGSDTRQIRAPSVKLPKNAGNRRGRAARKALDRRKSAVEKRSVRRKTVTKSRAASSRKNRQAARRGNRHKSRRAAAPAPRRGVVRVAPRRQAPARSTPAVQYLSPAHPHQVGPGGYYVPSTGATVVR